MLNFIQIMMVLLSGGVSPTTKNLPMTVVWLALIKQKELDPGKGNVTSGFIARMSMVVTPLISTNTKIKNAGSNM